MPEETLTSVAQISIYTKRKFFQFMALLMVISSIGWPVFVILFHLGDMFLIQNILICLFGLLILFLLRFKKSIFGLSIIFTLASMWSLVSYVNWQHVETGEILYLMAFPVFAYFLWGKKYGFVWSIVFACITLVVELISSPANLVVNLFVQMFLSIGFSMSILHFYQDTTDKSEALVKINEQKLQENIARLKTEIDSRLQVQKELAQNVHELEEQKKELERINRLMVDRELAMINLKEKIKNLEEELLKSKIAV